MEGIGTHKPETREREPDLHLKELWRKYDFPGTPPFKGSVSEGRLQQACRDYERIVSDLSSPRTYRGDSENYVPRDRAVKRASSSDSKRREIHNQIALMVMGQQRSGMNSVMAEHIAEFALEYVEDMQN